MADKKKTTKKKAVAPRSTAQGFGFEGGQNFAPPGSKPPTQPSPDQQGPPVAPMQTPNLPPSSMPGPLQDTYTPTGFGAYQPGMPSGPGPAMPDIYNMPTPGMTPGGGMPTNGMDPTGLLSIMGGGQPGGGGGLYGPSTAGSTVDPAMGMGMPTPGMSGSYANDPVLGGVTPAAAFNLMGDDRAYYDQYANQTGMDLYSGNYALGMQNADNMGMQYLMQNQQGIDPLGQSQFNQGMIQNNATPGGQFYTAQDFSQQAFQPGSQMFNYIFAPTVDQYGNTQPKTSEQMLANYLGAMEATMGAGMSEEQGNALASHYGMILRDYKLMENAGQATMGFPEYLAQRLGIQP